MAKVFLFANQKGGVGKTTVSLTVATRLAMMGFRVLMLDADSQQNLSKWRANAQGEAHEADLPWVERWDSAMIGEKVKKEHDNYDYIIIDSAGHIGQRGDSALKLMIAAIKSADVVFCPVAPSHFDVDGSKDFVDLMRDIWARAGEETPALYFLINGVREGTILAKEVSDYVADEFGLPVLANRLQMREVYRQCIGSGATIFHMKDEGAKDNAIAVINEILERVNTPTDHAAEAV